MKILLFSASLLCINYIYAQYTSINITSSLCSTVNYAFCLNITNIKYRTSNGACNNLMRYWYGMSNSPMKRFNGMPSAYADLYGNPRSKSVSGIKYLNFFFWYFNK